MPARLYKTLLAATKLLVAMAALAAGYFIAGKLGLKLAFVHQSATAVWAPTGIALSALLAMGYRVWPGVWLGAFLVNLTTAGTVATSIGIATGNTLEGLVGAYLVNRFAGGRDPFSRPQTVFTFAVLAGTLSPTVAATFGVTSLALGGFAAWADYGSIWLTWWLGDAVGAFVVAPLLLLWSQRPRTRWSRAQALEGALLLLSLLLVGMVIFGGLLPSGYGNHRLSFLSILPLLWAAFRFGPREAVTASFVLSGIAVWGTMRGFGPLIAQSRHESLLVLQGFLGLIAVVALGVAATVMERKRAIDRTARLQAVTAALSGAPTPADIAQIVVNEGAAAMEARSGMVALLKGSEDLKVLGFVNFPGETIEAWQQFPLWETPLGEAVRRGEPLLFESVEALLRSYPRLGTVVHAMGGGARAAIPLQAHGETVGGIWLAFSERRSFDADDQALMIALAQQYAQALERARLYEVQQAARATAEAANRVKDEFLATMSHELRTPLTAMLGWARMLRSGKLDEAGRSQALDIIERNAKAQAKLIEDILDVSRIVTGKLRLTFRPIRLTEVIHAAVDALRPAAEAKGIAVERVLDPEAGLVLGDPDRLQQVVWNLVSNAIKFTPQGGRVEVGLRRAQPCAEITVSDTGEGIDAGFLPHLFERFRQADGSTTRAHGGLGLGLAIVRHLAELHGGTVHASSAGKGRGATFTVRLPLAARQPAPSLGTDRERVPAGTEAEAERARKLRGLRVLVVDDNADTLNWVIAVLGPYGVEVRTAASARLAMETLEGFTADILISDIGLPGDDGYAFIQQVRTLEGKREEPRSIPAIALTAYAKPEDRQRALDSGYQIHLAKPLEPAALVAAVGRLCGQTGK